MHLYMIIINISQSDAKKKKFNDSFLFKISDASYIVVAMKCSCYKKVKIVRKKNIKNCIF